MLPLEVCSKDIHCTCSICVCTVLVYVKASSKNRCNDTLCKVDLFLHISHIQPYIFGLNRNLHFSEHLLESKYSCRNDQCLSAYL